MAAVRGLRVSVKAEAPAGPALGLPSPEADSGLERGEPEPMEVEEGELEIVPVRRSLKELIPVRAGGGGEEEVAELVPRCGAGPAGKGDGRRLGPGEVRGRGKRGVSAQGAEAPGLRRDGEREKGRRGARKWVLRGLEKMGETKGYLRTLPLLLL